MINDKRYQEIREKYLGEGVMVTIGDLNEVADMIHDIQYLVSGIEWMSKQTEGVRRLMSPKHGDH